VGLLGCFISISPCERREGGREVGLDKRRKGGCGSIGKAINELVGMLHFHQTLGRRTGGREGGKEGCGCTYPQLGHVFPIADFAHCRLHRLPVCVERKSGSVLCPSLPPCLPASLPPCLPPSLPEL